MKIKGKKASSKEIITSTKTRKTDMKHGGLKKKKNVLNSVKELLSSKKGSAVKELVNNIVDAPQQGLKFEKKKSSPKKKSAIKVNEGKVPVRSPHQSSKTPTPKKSVTPKTSLTPKASLVPKKSVTPKTSLTPKASLVPKKSSTPKASLVPKKSSTPKASLVPKKSSTPKNKNVSEKVDGKIENVIETPQSSGNSSSLNLSFVAPKNAKKTKNTKRLSKTTQSEKKIGSSTPISKVTDSQLSGKKKKNTLNLSSIFKVEKADQNEADTGNVLIGKKRSSVSLENNIKHKKKPPVTEAKISNIPKKSQVSGEKKSKKVKKKDKESELPSSENFLARNQEDCLDDMEIENEVPPIVLSPDVLARIKIRREEKKLQILAKREIRRRERERRLMNIPAGAMYKKVLSPDVLAKREIRREERKEKYASFKEYMQHVKKYRIVPPKQAKIGEEPVKGKLEPKKSTQAKIGKEPVKGKLEPKRSTEKKINAKEKSKMRSFDRLLKLKAKVLGKSVKSVRSRKSGKSVKRVKSGKSGKSGKRVKRVRSVRSVKKKRRPDQTERYRVHM